jgi:5-methylcytosine-specific restriction endonuclease McrA
LIKKWLIGALLNNVFGGSSDNTIGVSREIIKNSLQTSSDFPYLALVDGLAKKRGRVSNFDENNINALFDIRYSNKTAFLALSLLYDNIDWGSTAYHIDHIIPKSLAGKNRLANLDLPESQKELIINSVDRIGNLQLLLSRENLEKNNKPFDEWVATRDPEFLKKHLIPADKSIWKIEQLPAFVEEREKLMREYLSKDY